RRQASTSPSVNASNTLARRKNVRISSMGSIADSPQEPLGDAVVMALQIRLLTGTFYQRESDNATHCVINVSPWCPQRGSTPNWRPTNARCIVLAQATDDARRRP
ncbi:MAG: hypothetical protein KA978_25390, partial [Deltaproteobacteria bacterium]|nr:hypothetical protein [Deltaproteobacteria bacterium]